MRLVGLLTSPADSPAANGLLAEQSEAQDAAGDDEQDVVALGGDPLVHDAEQVTEDAA